jgi:2-oxoglutarate ferredoxin oxidoreductase subunit beta
MITQAMSHRGFSYLHILSPCVTFDKTHRTYSNLGMQVRDLPEDHDPSDRLAAMREAMHDATPALGLYFREERPTLGDALDGLVEKAGGELVAKAAAAKPGRKAARR